MPGTFEVFDQRAATVSISASTTSADEAITAGFPHLLVTNATSAIAFVKCGVGAQTATAERLPINPNSQAVIAITIDTDTVAVLLASSSGTVYVTPGYGV
jgi:hypothetical protein